MNALEHELTYPWDERLPADGELIMLHEGVYWLRMPLPFALNHINLYLLADEIDGCRGWTLIDCGIASDAVRQLWEQIFQNGLQGLPILRVICTHTHPDHIGLAAMICERYSCRLWMTLGEYTLGRILSTRYDPQKDPQGLARATQLAVEHFERHGIHETALLEAVRERSANYFSTLVPDMPRSFVRIRADEAIMINGQAWQVIIGTGHSPEHASLYCAQAGLLLSGDMVLPRISTNVSVFEIEPEANPVEWFMRSLDAYAHCAEDTLVLPSHGKPFRGLAQRIVQLKAHHAERLEALQQAMQGGTDITARDAIKIVFGREFDFHQLNFALGEALAHLHCLWYRGQVQRIQADGQVRFRIKPTFVE